MSELFLQLLGSSGQFAEIQRFEGPPRRGYLRPSQKLRRDDSNSSANGASDLPPVSFHPEHPEEDPGARELDWSSVKTIDLLSDAQERPEPQIRFFDAAEICAHLWVRVTLKSSEVLEGRIDNSLESLCSAYLLLYPLEESSTRKCICVPRHALADLQIVALRP